jgi:RNA recognition motif-containing protein
MVGGARRRTGFLPVFAKVSEAIFQESSRSMGKKLYVGNLTFEVTDADLLKMFEPHGTVRSAQVIMDRDTGRSKGFGFVEMESDQQATAAIAALNGQDHGGRAVTVNEARPKPEGGRGRGGSGGGRRY